VEERGPDLRRGKEVATARRLTDESTSSSRYALRKSIREENVDLLDAAATTSLRRELQDELAYFNSISAEDLEDDDYSEEDGVELNRLLALLTAVS
jgi:hypothetical protein